MLMIRLQHITKWVILPQTIPIIDPLMVIVKASTYQQMRHMLPLDLEGLCSSHPTTSSTGATVVVVIAVANAFVWSVTRLDLLIFGFLSIRTGSLRSAILSFLTLLLTPQESPSTCRLLLRFLGLLVCGCKEPISTFQANSNQVNARRGHAAYR